MPGSTGFGWPFALVWAFGAAHRSEDVGGSHGGESGLNLFVNDVRSVRIATGPDRAEATMIPARLTATEAVQQIERLDRLRAAGHIDVEEFMALKAGVLRQVWPYSDEKLACSRYCEAAASASAVVSP